MIIIMRPRQVTKRGPSERILWPKCVFQLICFFQFCFVGVRVAKVAVGTKAVNLENRVEKRAWQTDFYGT